MRIDWEYLEHEYDSLPTREVIRSSTKPEGSLTDNVRKQKVVRDSTHKRFNEFQSRGFYDEDT